ncbi:hypothetical protein AVEN_253186-1, partial [Araneus ventricosus]
MEVCRVPSLYQNGAKTRGLKTVDKSGVGRKGPERTWARTRAFPLSPRLEAARKGTAVGHVGARGMQDDPIPDRNIPGRF